MSKAYPVRVSDGSRLVTSLSLESIGEANWSRKLNMRRFSDQEIRQEGWVKFHPLPLPTTTAAKIGDFIVDSGDEGTEFDVTNGGSDIGAWVPLVPPAAGWYIWVVKVDAGNTVTVYQDNYPGTTTPLGVLTVSGSAILISSNGSIYTATVFPSGLPESQYVFDGSENILRLAELVRPNGDRVVVGAGRTKLKKFNTGTGVWSDINGGLTFSSSGKRWQVETMNGYLILNNTVDLMVSYRVEDAAVKPIYELRQVGIAAVERIRQYNGFLLLGNVLEIKADQLDHWMNGYSNYTVGGTSAKVANFTITYPTDLRKEFDVTTGASAITVTLPNLTFDDTNFYFWLKKSDAGAGTVITTPLIADEQITLVNQNDKALVWWTGSAWAAKYFPLGVIPATDPYGTPPTDITQRVPYEVITGEFGQPTNWAPLFDTVLGSSSATIYLPFVPSTWIAGQTRVAVINGGPGGETLGGQPGYEDGILITAIGVFDPLNGVPITLEIPTDGTLTYPRSAQVTRWTDISTLVARYLLQDDGSAIVGMELIQQLVVIYRETSIYLGRYTGDATNPFVFTPRYPGDESLNLPLWGDAIVNVNGQYHLYPGIGNRFYQFNGFNWPTVHQVCDQAKELFFTGVVGTDEVFAVTNFATKQVWFCTPVLTFAYDLEFDSVSEIDAIIGAGCFCLKPGGTDRWFIMAIGKNVFTYGLVSGASPILTWLRDGVVPTAILKSGLISAGLMGDEKLMTNYTPVLASSSGDAALDVQLRSTYNPSGVLADLLSPVESLPTPQGENFFTTYFQAIFFQDEITLVDTRDIDFRISQRIFEFNQVGDNRGGARGVTRAVGLT